MHATLEAPTFLDLAYASRLDGEDINVAIRREWDADDARRAGAELLSAADLADRAAWAEATRDEMSAAELMEQEAIEEAAAQAEFEDAWAEYDSFNDSPAGRYEFGELCEMLGSKAYSAATRGF